MSNECIEHEPKVCAHPDCCDRYKAVAADRKLKQERKQHVFKAIRTVLFVWLDAYPDDFDEPPNYPCLTSLKSFAAQHMQSSDVERCVQRCLRRYVGQDGTTLN